MNTHTNYQHPDYATNNPSTRPLRADVRLRNGRIVTFTHAWNGSQNAHMADGGVMTDAEWNELSASIRTGSAVYRTQSL
jgi:hypothetical protein